MLKYLLEQWSKSPEPWFSLRQLKNISPDDFERLKAMKVLIYDLPKDNATDRHCPHGCPLMVEGMEAFCLNHPEEGVFSVVEEQLNRYRFSIENFLKQVVKVNGLKGGVCPFDGGYYFGSKEHGDKTIGLVMVADVPGAAGLCERLKDCYYIFIITLSEMPLLGDRIVLMSVDEALDYDTLAIAFDRGLEKLRLRGELKDICLDIPGVTNNSGEYEIKINGREIYLSDAPFILLLRFVQGAMTEKDRWVSVNDLISEGIIPADGVYQGINRFKEKFEPYLSGREFLENSRKKYRLSPNVTEIKYDRIRLLAHDSGRVREIARMLPKR